MSAPVLAIIGAPSSAGAYAPGQEKAPAAFRKYGLIEALSARGRQIVDRGDTPGFRWRPDAERPQAMNLDAVADIARWVAASVRVAIAEGENVLVLGGDCTVELGTAAGALHDSASVGLVYIDHDVDLNVPETSDGALDWTGVAHLLDLPGAEPALTSLSPRRPMLRPDDILYFGADNITPAEAVVVERHRIERISSAEVRADPTRAAERAAEWGARFDRLLIHFDVDALAFTQFPIAENTRRCAGLELGEAFAAIRRLTSLPNWRALTVTEVNPDHAPDEAATFGRFIDELSRALA
jgi:arginase